MTNLAGLRTVMINGTAALTLSSVESVHLFMNEVAVLKQYDGGAGADGVIAGTGSITANLNAGFDLIEFVLDQLPDTLSGGSGIDTLALRDSVLTGGKTWDLAAGTLTVGGTTIVRMTGFENLELTKDYLLLGAGSILNQPNTADLIRGTNGRNKIVGDYGADTIEAGGGNDDIGLVMADGTLKTVYGGSGTDLIKMGQASVLSGAGGGMNMTGTQGNRVVITYAGLDIVQGFDIESVSIFGSRGNDTMKGTFGNDTLTGLSGNDLVMGNKGDDFLAVNSGHDSLSGGLGADTFGISFDVRDAALVNFTVTDFGTRDRLEFSRVEFAEAIDAETDQLRLVIGDDPVAQVAAMTFLYDLGTGDLWLDQDGSESDAAIHLGRLLKSGQAAVLEVSQVDLF